MRRAACSPRSQPAAPWPRRARAARLGARGRTCCGPQAAASRTWKRRCSRGAHRPHGQGARPRRRVGRTAAARLRFATAAPRPRWAPTRRIVGRVRPLRSITVSARMDIATYMQGVGTAGARRRARRSPPTPPPRTARSTHGRRRSSATRDACSPPTRRISPPRARPRLDAPLIDRLTLTEKTVAAMAEGLRQIAAAARPDRRNQRTASTAPPASRSAACACRSA